MSDVVVTERMESAESWGSVPRLPHRLAHLYATWLVSHPVINGLLTVTFLIAPAVVAICFSELPSFDDPAKEFITIGTPMAARLYQLKALQQNTLSLPTKEYGHSRVARSDKMADKVKFCFELPDQGSNELWSRFESMSKVVVSLYAVEERMNTTFLTAPGAVKSLCRLQTRFEGLPGYRQLCSKASLTDVNSACCPIWSLANFIASIVNKTSCHQITEGDVKRVKNLYETCKKPFLSGELKRACWDATAPSRWLCPDVPPQCFAHPHLLLLLAIAAPPPYHHHYLNGAGGWNVTLLVLPVWKRVGLKLWHLASLDRPQTLTDLTRNLTPPLTIEAIELGLYGELAGRYVAWDSVWLALGAACLALLLLLLTHGSVAVVGATFLALGWSLILAYGLYARFLQLPTFPLLNMMALVLLLGLGADDILLFYQIWVSIHPRNDCCGDVATDEGSGDEKAARLRLRAQRMADTLRHAVPSVCLTSLSTLGGLLVSLNSAIVAVKRFSVYASLTVLCHVVYVLAVMPTLLLLFVPPHRRRCCHFLRPLRLPRFCLADLLVIKMRFTFPLLLLSVIVTSAYLLFHAGWLTFPFGPLQPAFYRPAHPAEVYRLRGGEFSWAEYTLRSHRSLISLHLVWGVQPHDPRNHWTWTPYDNDVVVPQPLWREDFNLTTPVSLSWLSAFCSEITKMPRSFAPPSILPRSSFLEEDALLLSQNYGCVFGRSVFSFRDFNESTPMCYQNTASCLTAFAEASSIPTGMRFSLDTARIVGLVISATVNFSLANTTFSAVQEFTQHVETWFSTLLATAPNGLLGGFLASPELTAFEAYQDVLKFLPLSLGLSVALAALLVLLATLNLPLAVAALVSVVASLLLSCLLLILLGGWTLGIVEALILSLSAGLAVDPCIHLALAIIRSNGNEDASWKRRCQRALGTVGWAVTGAALSTALAGSAVLPSHLKCYQQMGLFLLILMTSALLLCGIAFVGSVACLPDKCIMACWRNRETTNAAVS
ncbi:Protein dispatched -like protein 1 [Echinococcus granulosus]|nr:Protein dispatched -like protein 1 [Echinococcus granulosus]